MANWYEYVQKDIPVPSWPYPVHYGQEQEIETDILVLGGGIAGCWAAIGAARKGMRVALVEKSATKRSGAGGSGCDNWCDVPAHPLINVNPDEWARRCAGVNGGYGCGIGRQIQCRENYDALLELEKMGGKIRDYNGEYRGSMGYDEKSKFVIYTGLSPLKEVIVWGNTFKPAMKKECERLGVKIYDRVMATSLLTERGLQGARVVGATGLNSRTGEFLVFKAKATILCMAGASTSIWVFNTELAGSVNFHSLALSGDGAAMAWQAGAEFTLLERTGMLRNGTGFKHKWYGGTEPASYRNVELVDENGKSLGVRQWDGQGPSGRFAQWDAIREAVLRGEYALPFYGDFPSMPAIERKITWGMFVGEESTTKALVRMYNEAGFDPSKDMLQNYQLIDGESPPQFRDAGYGGGLVIDWDLKTNLEGLYAAGTQTYSPGDHSYAAATGRYAGRKAADYARQTGKLEISREQVEFEKARVYGPIKRSDGIDWKELHAGISRTMQYFCSQYKTEQLFRLGLESLQDIEKNWVPKLYAFDPHKLMRGLEDLSILTYAQMILHASLARKASSKFLDFHRIDYPQLDPQEWSKLITLKQENGKVKVGELPLDYAGNLKENYEAHNKDYTGVYNG
jgi:succinate dehydrogenase/fumarate reductase flavoprotein subunit